MRTETITRALYAFDELSEDAKEKALDAHRTCNLDHEWWDWTYEDAANVGIKITEFGLDRDRHADGEVADPVQTAIDIVANHGAHCSTHKTAAAFLKERTELIAGWTGDEDLLDDKLNELDEDFARDILEDYSIILQNEYAYLYSDEAVQETIEANEWEFGKYGNPA